MKSSGSGRPPLTRRQFPPSLRKMFITPQHTAALGSCIDVVLRPRIGGHASHVKSGGHSLHVRAWQLGAGETRGAGREVNAGHQLGLDNNCLEPTSTDMQSPE